MCIVGAGAAGMTLAMQLAAAGIEVLLLESGGEKIDAETQGLYAAEQVGIDYFDLSASRLRFLGGTTNHWAGYCRENDASEYAGRPELGVLGWPITYADIRPYVERAMRLLDLDPLGFTPEEAAAKAGYNPASLVEKQSQVLQTKVFQIAKRRRFRELHTDELKRAPGLRTLLYANVTHIQLDEAGRSVKHLTVRTLNGRQLEVRARTYVLATHAVENARLLLSSNDVRPAGVGNESGHVGRHFMEHLAVESGLMVASSKLARYYDHTTMQGHGLNPNISITDKAMREHGLMGYYCRLTPVVAKDQTLSAIDTLASSFWQPADLDTVRALGQVLVDVPGVIRFIGNRKFANAFNTANVYRLQHRIEQSPNGASRVTLSAFRDRLGMPKAKLEWALSDLDVTTFAKGQQLVARECERLGLGTFRLDALTPALIERSVQGRHHHMGTTRMSDAATDGVVDRQCKVHGLANLYVVGSSIFPTAGYAGPTMMLMAFAIRLGDHLAGERRKA